MKKINYYVIGGQYESICYGGTPTLIGAKRLATKNEEYRNNQQGWHKARTYRAEDTEIIESCGRISCYDGTKIRVPVFGAEPVE